VTDVGAATPAAIAVATPLTPSTVVPMRRIASAASVVAERTSPTSCAISAGRPRGLVRRGCFTSLATTANPLPASPARAASIVAFSASRFVRPAMSAMMSATELILPTLASSSSNRARAAALVSTAAPIVTPARVIRSPISWIDWPSRSPASATTRAASSADAAASSAPRAAPSVWVGRLRHDRRRACHRHPAIGDQRHRGRGLVLHRVRHPPQRGALGLLGLRLRRLLGGRQRAVLDRLVTEDHQRARHRADLVAAPGALDLKPGIAGR
jgi:hypothetical protein